MSILIKGMRKPKHCGYCTLNDGTFCYAVEGKEHELEDVEDYADIGERPKWCPLIEIPKHGRLIDADAFFEDICNDINAMTKIGIAVDGDWLWGKLDDALRHAPTVIEGDTE